MEGKCRISGRNEAPSKALFHEKMITFPFWKIGEALTLESLIKIMYFGKCFNQLSRKFITMREVGKG